jgi:hypothetical protein
MEKSCLAHHGTAFQGGTLDGRSGKMTHLNSMVAGLLPRLPNRLSNAGQVFQCGSSDGDRRQLGNGAMEWKIFSYTVVGGDRIRLSSVLLCAENHVIQV